jgi:hypothetical protein
MVYLVLGHQLVSNTVSGSYVFTPNPSLHPCATTQTLNVTVLPLISHRLLVFPRQFVKMQRLQFYLITLIRPSITGSWSPATVNTALLGPVTYFYS